MNAAAFFEELNAQVFRYQNDGKFVMMGDFNSRLGYSSDFIEGVDVVMDRKVLDSRQNPYCDLFCDFLVSANCIVLNGRNNRRDDYTCISARGLSVVDYMVVPHGMFEHFSDFEVIRARDLFNASGCEGFIDPLYGNISDHSLLKCSLKIAEDEVPSEGVAVNGCKSKVIYDRKNIPDTFMEGDIIGQIQDTITALESSHKNQKDIDEAYCDFTSLMTEQMNTRLDHKTVKPHSDRVRKWGKKHKVWWHEGLSLLWARLCQSEKE